MHNYWFYSSPVVIDDKDFQEIASILEAKGTLKKWMGEKLCDGFHPDWLVRLPASDGPATYLICFGCHEAKVIINGMEMRYDLSDAAYSDLAKYLREKQINRPDARPSGNYLQ